MYLNVHFKNKFLTWHWLTLCCIKKTHQSSLSCMLFRLCCTVFHVFNDMFSPGDRISWEGGESSYFQRGRKAPIGFSSLSLGLCSNADLTRGGTLTVPLPGIFLIAYSNKPSILDIESQEGQGTKCLWAQTNEKRPHPNS